MAQPTLARRALGRGLRLLREAAGMSIPEAAAAIGYSRQTISRIERGQQPSRTQQVESLCRAYGAASERLSYLTALAVASAQRGWWEAHKDGAVAEFRVYAEAEQDAAVIETFEPEYIPGIAQVEAYIRALQAAAPPMAPGDADAVREFRLQRQARLFGRRPMPTIRMLIGMSTLDYLRSIPDVRGQQIERLLELDDRSTVEIRVADRLHPAMGAAFTILTPDDHDGPPFVHMDALDGCRYVEDADVVSHYKWAFEIARESASPIKEYLT